VGKTVSHGKEIAVRGQKHCAVFAMLVGLGALVPGSAAWAGGGYDYEQDGGNWGGNVKACSLAGVNPIHHPEIFGNAADAASYGFVRSADGTWHVQCYGGVPAATGNYASTTQRAPGHHRKTTLKPSGRAVKGE
jgi:hypothetical protein